MRLSHSPLLDRLEPAQSVLLAGAGGGFDVYGAVPLATSLAAAGKRVHLANLSFANLKKVTERPIHPAVAEVGPDTRGSNRYFPERSLARWYAEQGEPRAVYALEKTGAVPLREAYRRLVAHLRVDAVVLVDGGTDILMCGDEAGLGTPAEDMISLAAVDALDVPTRLVVCLGFGVDAHYGVCHAHFLENIAILQREGAYLGGLAVLPQMPEAQRYLEAVRYANALTRRPSIVHSSIASAVEGEFGNVHRTERTAGSELFINPLMSQYFAFDLPAVARRVMYMDAIRTTQTIEEVVAVCEAFQARRQAKPWRIIPV